MPIKRLEDIEREKHEERKNKIAEDISDVANKVFKSPEKNRPNILGYIAKISIFILIGIILLNLILGNIWLLKFFTKEFFPSLLG